MMFQGRIRLPEDTHRLDATLAVEGGRILIEVDGRQICDWPAEGVTLEHRPDGILLTLDGESLVVAPFDRYGFSDAVEAARRRTPTKRSRRWWRRARPPRAAPVATPAVEDQPPTPEPVPDPPQADQNLAIPPAIDEPPPTPLMDETTRQPPSEEGETSGWTDLVLDRSAETPPAGTEPPMDINQEIFGHDHEHEPSAKGPSIWERARNRWAGLERKWKLAVIGVLVGVPAAVLATEVVATTLALAGLGLCLLGGAGMADPHYTRKLPPELTEIRLLIAGTALILVGFLIGLPAL